jgi:maltose phosphorylase
LKINEEIGGSNNKLMSEKEIKAMRHIVENVYFPLREGTKIFLQQDGFMDKEQLSTSDLPLNERPINQHWSWDRILRSIFIKQADVLQGLYLFEDHFDLETIRANFDFYEPKTVHESSLSPCVHVILAAKIGNLDKAYELYLRTSRLDLDDYNHEADEGLHITSMAGTWMSVVEGMAGVRVYESGLEINPTIPEAWQSYTFRILYQTIPLEVSIDKNNVSVKNLGSSAISCVVMNAPVQIASGEEFLTKI